MGFNVALCTRYKLASSSLVINSEDLFQQTARERFPEASLSSKSNEAGDRVIQVFKEGFPQQCLTLFHRY